MIGAGECGAFAPEQGSETHESGRIVGNFRDEVLEKGRFAPSPSGRMHLGNLFAMLLAYLDARAVGGSVVLRMEDLDLARCRPAYVQQLAEDLRWLGLSWEEGYEKGGAQGPYLQSERGAIYEAEFQKLTAAGRVYPCWCSRAERLTASAPHLGDEQDIGHHCPCHALSAAQRGARALLRPAAWRVEVPNETISFIDGNYGPQSQNLAQVGDFLVRRSDGVFAYQLAVVADDARMGVTRVVRGRDLLGVTAGQIWLFRQLGYSAPRYSHIPLLCAEDGRRLSKRDGDFDLEAMRKAATPQRLLGELAALAGLLPAAREMEIGALEAIFHWENVAKYDQFMNEKRATTTM